MNIIINGFYEDIFDPFIKKVLETLKVEKCDLLNTYTGTELNFCNLRKYNIPAVTWGDYSVDENDLIPLDAEVLEEMQDCEVIVLKMMDRLEFMRELNYAFRKQVYLRHLRYWNDRLTNVPFSVFLSSNIPHEVFDYVLYCLCKKKNIPTYFFFQSLTIPDSIFLISDWKNSMEEIAFRYQELQETIQGGVELSTVYEEHFLSLTKDDDNPVPFYMNERDIGMFSRVTKKWVLLKQKIREKKLTEIKEKFCQKLSAQGRRKRAYKKELRKQQKRLDKYYLEVSCVPDLNREYVYLPLHYQPEITTSPLAGVYVDQILIVQMLSYCLPENIMIYVKEHPLQGVFSRCIEFYQELQKIKKVVLVSKEVNSFELMKHSRAVATATGTAGWEALFKRKPVLMFGTFFYQHYDSVFRIQTIQDCREAIRCVFVENKRPDFRNLRLFLKAVNEVTINAFIDMDYKEISLLDDRQSMDNLFRALLKRLSDDRII